MKPSARIEKPWTKHIPLLFLMLALALWAAMPLPAHGQSTTSGDITGVITDPSGAAIPGATITLTNVNTGAVKVASTGVNGSYRFSLLPPGTYTVNAAATGFTPRKAQVQVLVGQVEAANLALQVGAAAQQVTVTAEAAPVQINNANISTGFTPAQVALVPNGGGDLTQTVQASPGAVMNTQAGYGNFSTFGLPATSNLFTVNGQADNDPFLNLNNSGASNLLLGQSGVQEVTVVNNGYSGQYGGLGGANVNYVTKQGTNDWHGNAVYNWNGRVMNANNFINNATGVDRPFVNANQWSAGFGGPIFKDKTFFYVNTDGIDVVLPTNVQARIPSPQFQAATLANLAATGNAGEIPFYQTIFGLYNGAKGAAGATPVADGGCGTFTSLGAGVPCALQFQSTAGNHTHEWDLSARVDQHFGSNDLMYFRFSTDHGLQATYTDPISPAFNIDSNQPQYQGQLNWTHSFTGGEATNQFIANASHYEAIFGADPASRLAVMPISLRFAGGAFSRMGGINYDFPQGRNVNQYGVTDDYSQTMGSHTFKTGVDWRYNFVNDFGFGILNSPLVGMSLDGFFNGVSDFSEQSFATSLNQPIRVWGLGAYVEDDYAVSPNLKLTLALRAEHHSNPVCLHDCIARLSTPFTDLAHDPNVPYNQIIDSNQRRALPGIQQILWQPRIGLAWTPFASQNTVLRGGFGIFNDTAPGVLAETMAMNSPLFNTFVVTGPISPTVPGNGLALAAADNASFLSAFANGGTVGSIMASNPAFTPPNYTSTPLRLKAARYYEWNLAVQQAIGNLSSVTLNYVGNHGSNEPIQNDAINAFSPTPFAGLPATAPDPRFGTVTQVVPGGNSNYNGLTVSFSRKMARSFQLQANYTWSHALDEVSNGGFLPFNFNTNTSILGVQDPNNIRAFNYGNADYDIRHYFSLNYVWQVPFSSVFHWGANQLWQGWTISGTLFTRSGLPFTVIDSAANSTLQATNYGGNSSIFATAAAPGVQASSCSYLTQCLNPTNFSVASATPTGFGSQVRNQFRGPKFFDTDLSIIKNTQFPGWERGQLGLGVQFFNLFNHPNFDQPVGDIADPEFGQIINTVSVPTSMLGSFLGGDASPRLIQLTAKIVF